MSFILNLLSAFVHKNTTNKPTLPYTKLNYTGTSSEHMECNGPLTSLAAFNNNIWAQSAETPVQEQANLNYE